jgi:hypothetical protein
MYKQLFFIDDSILAEMMHIFRNSYYNFDNYHPIKKSVKHKYLKKIVEMSIAYQLITIVQDILWNLHQRRIG